MIYSLSHSLDRIYLCISCTVCTCQVITNVIEFLSDDEVALVRFTPENEFDSWILMLGEVWCNEDASFILSIQSILADMDLLRSTLRGWNSLGRAWTRFLFIS